MIMLKILFLDGNSQLDSLDAVNKEIIHEDEILERNIPKNNEEIEINKDHSQQSNKDSLSDDVNATFTGIENIETENDLKENQVFIRHEAVESLPQDFDIRLQHLKRNISDTLTFLHQERNDFLPEDDIIIPSRKDDHVHKEINLDFITDKSVIKTKPQNVEGEFFEDEISKENIPTEVKKTVKSEIDELVKLAEDVVNDNNETKSVSLAPTTKTKSKEKASSDSKIPISSHTKVKTIKKHSKDPLKEFVKLSQDVDWEDPSLLPEENLKDKGELSNKSKIPVLMTETVKISNNTNETVTSSCIIDSNLTLPSAAGASAQLPTKNNTLDSDSDTDSRPSPPLKGILKKGNFRTVGSSSGSDVALHESGAELSDEESG